MKLILAMALFGTLLAARVWEPMQVTEETITSCGYECDLTDGYLGADEFLTFAARGGLLAGQTFTYTYLPTKSARYIYASASSYKGRDADMQVDIWSDFGHASGVGEACLKWYWSNATTPWRVEVTNISGRDVRNVFLWGRNEMEWGQVCP